MTPIDQALRSDIDIAIASDKGQVRNANEDSVGYFEPEDPISFSHKGRLAIVADGMGGVVGGKIASEIVVSIVSQTYFEHLDLAPRDALTSALNRAALVIEDQVKQRPELEGMGSTAVCLVQLESQIFIANVGDSRAYLFRQNKLTQISHDHSVLMEAIRNGMPAAEAAEKYPSNYITNAIGARIAKPRIDFFEISLEPNDIFLLCSDGLTGELDDQIIQETFATTQTMDEASRQLIQKAYKAGGTDNITLIALKTVIPDQKGKTEVSSSNPKASRATPKKSRAISFALIPFLAILIALGVFYPKIQTMLDESKETTDTKEIKSSIEPTATQKETGSEAQPVAIQNVEPTSTQETKPEVEPVTQPATKSEVQATQSEEPTGTQETKPEAKTIAQPTAKPEVQATQSEEPTGSQGTKPEVKIAAQPATKPAVQITPSMEPTSTQGTKPEVQTVAQSALEPQTQPAKPVKPTAKKPKTEQRHVIKIEIKGPPPEGWIVVFDDKFTYEKFFQEICEGYLDYSFQGCYNNRIWDRSTKKIKSQYERYFPKANEQIKSGDEISVINTIKMAILIREAPDEDRLEISDPQTIEKGKPLIF